jgi:membrane-bound lytic murein transglycosylase D
VESAGPFNYDKVKVPTSTHLKWIAKAAGMDLSELRALNPSLRREKTPPDSALFEINLPPGKKEVFEKTFWTQTAPKNAKKHRVRPGENLSRIAKKYRVNLQNLCALNGLSHNTAIRPGLVLLLPSSQGVLK